MSALAHFADSSWTFCEVREVPKAVIRELFNCGAILVALPQSCQRDVPRASLCRATLPRSARARRTDEDLPSTTADRGVTARQGGTSMVGKLAFASLASFILLAPALVTAQTATFRIEETTIEVIQGAIMRGELTSTRVVQLYLDRIKAYNGTCVNQPDGLLG